MSYITYVHATDKLSAGTAAWVAVRSTETSTSTSIIQHRTPTHTADRNRSAGSGCISNLGVGTAAWAAARLIESFTTTIIQESYTYIHSA